MEKINLQTINSFILTPDEIQSLYTHLALFEYKQFRVPEYKEELLMQQLTTDFKKLLAYSQELVEQNPKNHGAHKIAAFFDRHYKKLLTLQSSI